jgi:hypothetical protein
MILFIKIPIALHLLDNLYIHKNNIISHERGEWTQPRYS